MKMKISNKKRSVFSALKYSAISDCDNPRRGTSTLALLVFTACLIAASFVFVSFKFPAGNSGSGFLGNISSSFLKTFGNIFSAQGEKPVLEVNLEDSPSGRIKIPEKMASAEENSTSDENEKTSGALLKNNDLKTIATDIKNFPSTPVQNENFTAPLPMKEIKIQRKTPECGFSKIEIPNHQILFSEINWMGSKGSANDEWIEIKNNSGKNIELAGWQIFSGDEKIKIAFKDGGIPAGGLYLLERTDDTSAPGVAADMIYSGTLSNASAYLKIFDPDCNISDEIDASEKWPAGDSAAKKTMERSFLDFSWHTSSFVGGTPKKENSAAFAVREQDISFKLPFIEENTQSDNNANGTNAAPAAPSGSSEQSAQNQPNMRILIAGVQITGGTGKTDNDFVKIFNPSAISFNLKGYRLIKRTKTGVTDTSLKSWISDTFIPAGGFYIWANSSLAGTTPAPDTMTTGSLAADNGVAIRQGPEDTGTIIDAVAWGGAQNIFIEGNVFPANPGANQILSRKSSGGSLQDTDNNQNDFEIK